MPTPGSNLFINLVLEYATARNAIGREFSSKAAADPEADLFPEFESCYRPVFEAYASDKRRVYGGKAVSFGEPADFGGIERALESTAMLKSRRRAEVYFKTANAFNAEYKFVLVPQAGDLKTDNAKYRWYGGEGWRPLIL